jgi:hypothetical protein
MSKEIDSPSVEALKADKSLPKASHIQLSHTVFPFALVSKIYNAVVKHMDAFDTSHVLELAKEFNAHPQSIHGLAYKIYAAIRHQFQQLIVEFIDDKQIVVSKTILVLPINNFDATKHPPRMVSSKEALWDDSHNFLYLKHSQTSPTETVLTLRTVGPMISNKQLALLRKHLTYIRELNDKWFLAFAHDVSDRMSKRLTLEMCMFITSWTRNNIELIQQNKMHLSLQLHNEQVNIPVTYVPECGVKIDGPSLLKCLETMKKGVDDKVNIVDHCRYCSKFVATMTCFYCSALLWCSAECALEHWNKWHSIDCREYNSQVSLVQPATYATVHKVQPTAVNKKRQTTKGTLKSTLLHPIAELNMDGLSAGEMSTASRSSSGADDVDTNSGLTPSP